MNNKFDRQINNLNLLLQSAPIAAITVSHTGEILSINNQVEEMFGFKQTELLGESIELLVPHHLRSLHEKYRNLYYHNPRTRSMGEGLELVGLRKDGSEFPIEVGLSFTHVEEVLLVQAFIKDITLRKQTENLLEQRVKERTSEIEQRRKIADSLRDMLTILNSNHGIQRLLDYIARQASRLLGANASVIYRLLEETELSLRARADYGLPDQFLEQCHTLASDEDLALAITQGQQIVLRNLKSATLLELLPTSAIWQKQLLDCGYCALLIIPLSVKGTFYGGLALFYTTTQRFSPEELNLATSFSDQVALAIENARLRTQVKQAAVAAERSRLARDLHDSVTQTLFSATVIAEVLPRLWQRNIPETERRLQELRQLTRGALAEMRTLLLELRPSALVEVPLGDLLRQLTEAVTGRAQLPITLTLEGQPNVTPNAQVALYRIAQEALNNVAKHAQANKATISLCCHGNRVQLSIHDDGHGFILQEIKPNHLGLNIMQERADAIGATLNIQTEPGQGTQITVTWEAKEKRNE